MTRKRVRRAGGRAAQVGVKRRRRGPAGLGAGPGATRVTLALALALGACVDGAPVSPGDLTRVVVAPAFSLLAAAALDLSSLDRVVVRVVRPPSLVLAEASAAIPPGKEPIVVDLTVELSGSRERLRIEAELWAGATLAFSGSRTESVSVADEVRAFNVDLERRIPELTLSQGRLEFEGQAGAQDPEPRGFEVENEGPGSLSWSASPDVEWIEVSPDHGFVPEGEKQRVSVGVRSRDLPPGSHRGQVVVEAPGVLGAPASVEVDLTLEEPRVETFGLRVDGEGDGVGSVTSTPEGIDCTVDRGDVSGRCEADFPDGTALTLTAAATAGHSFGGWSGDCAGAGSCALTIDADRRVAAAFSAPAPELLVEPTALAFTAEQGRNPDPPEGTFTVTNAGGGSLDWTADTELPWAELSPTDGSLEGGRSSTVRVRVRSEGLPSGTHSGVVSVRAGETLAEVRVTLEVLAAPELSVVTDTVRFAAIPGNNPAPDTAAIVIENVGGGTLEWRAKVGGAWLTLRTENGSLEGGARGTVVLIVRSDDLSPGTYREEVEITAGDAGRAVVPLVLVVAAAASFIPGGQP